MPMERRETRRVNQLQRTSWVCAVRPLGGYVRWAGYTGLRKQDLADTTVSVAVSSMKRGIIPLCFEWNHQPKSRMRENRTSGSERSGGR